MLTAAVGALLVLGLGALLVTRNGDEPQQVTAGGTEGSTTTVIATTSTSVPVVSEPPSTPAPPTTSTTRAPGPTGAPTAPTTAPTRPSQPTGPQLETQAGGHAPVAAALAQARTRWAAAKPARGYTWSYDNECFCIPRKVEVVVDGAGNPTAARALDGTTVPQGFTGLTVQGAFDELQRAVDRDAASIRVRFDERTGLPVSYYIDQSRNVADEEHGITLIAFSPRS